MSESQSGDAISTIRKASSIITEGYLDSVKKRTKDGAFSQHEAQEKSFSEIVDDEKTRNTMDKLVNSALKEGASEVDILNNIHEGAQEGEIRHKKSAFTKTLNDILEILKL